MSLKKKKKLCGIKEWPCPKEGSCKYNKQLILMTSFFPPTKFR